MDFQDESFRAIDNWVDRHPTRQAHGWHEDDLDPYDPAIQQVRAELFEFLSLIREHGCRQALQIGLGMHGGSHFAFRQFCDSVTTVEYSVELIEQYKQHAPKLDDADRFVTGCSWENATVAKAKACAGIIDVLFIDGGHQFDEVKADWLAYKHMVRPGGIIAFHDSVRTHNPVGVAIDRFLEWLELEYGIAVTHIGTKLGIGYYLQAETAEPELQMIESCNDFTVLSNESGEGFWAVPETHAPTRLSEIRAGDHDIHLAAASRSDLDAQIATFNAVRERMDKARELLGAGDVHSCWQQVKAIDADYPRARIMLASAIDSGQNSTEMLAYAGVMTLASGEDAIQLLQRASERDPFDEQKLLMVAHTLRHVSEVSDHSEATVMIPMLRSVVDKLREPASRLIFADRH